MNAIIMWIMFLILYTSEPSHQVLGFKSAESVISGNLYLMKELYSMTNTPVAGFFNKKTLK